MSERRVRLGYGYRMQQQYAMHTHEGTKKQEAPEAGKSRPKNVRCVCVVDGVRVWRWRMDVACVSEIGNGAPERKQTSNVSTGVDGGKTG
jgi:hypothetical protein